VRSVSRWGLSRYHMELPLCETRKTKNGHLFHAPAHVQNIGTQAQWLGQTLCQKGEKDQKARFGRNIGTQTQWLGQTLCQKGEKDQKARFWAITWALTSRTPCLHWPGMATRVARSTAAAVAAALARAAAGVASRQQLVTVGCSDQSQHRGLMSHRTRTRPRRSVCPSVRA